MRQLLFAVIIFTQVTAFALKKDEACQLVKEKKMEVSIIAANIANINTTRTPEGGPYQQQALVCINHKCEIKKDTLVITKYLPDHPDADSQGYVKYPNIDLKNEMDRLIAATQTYDAANKNCTH